MRSRPSANGTSTLGPTQRGPDVAVAVVIVPCGFVGVMGIVRNQALQNLSHVVLDQAGFEFHRRQRGSAADNEKMEHALAAQLAQRALSAAH